MGDRGNFAIREAGAHGLHPQEAVFLYGHNTGEDMPEILRRALARTKDRWDHAAYLAREIYDQLLGPGDLDGFGISTRLGDTDRSVLLVLTVARRVVRVSTERYLEHGFEQLGTQPGLSFEDYVGVAVRTWDDVPSLEP